MTHDQIVLNIVISLAVGIVLAIATAVLQPLLKRAWERLSAPPALTPQTRGELIKQLLLSESELERLNYLSTNAKDLFLYLFRLCLAAMFLLLGSLWIYVVRLRVPPESKDGLLALVMVTSIFAVIFLGIAMWEATRMSDKRIEVTKKRIQKRIDDINLQLNAPDQP